MTRLFTPTRMLAAAVLISALIIRGDQEVRAPGAQIPSPSLPRYVYNVVAADFAAAGGHPLVKSKFNLYDPVGPTMEQFDAIAEKMRELNVDTYRIELVCGRQRSSFGTNTGVGGTAEKMEYDFQPLDHMMRKRQDVDVQLLASYGYTPAPLQDPTMPRGMAGKRRDTTPLKKVAKFGEAVAGTGTRAKIVRKAT